MKVKVEMELNLVRVGKITRRDSTHTLVKRQVKESVLFLISEMKELASKDMENAEVPTLSLPPSSLPNRLLVSFMSLNLQVWVGEAKSLPL